MTENILNIYKGLKEKTEFSILAGKEFGVSQTTIKTGWISGKLIPEEKQEAFLTFIVNYSKQEIEKQKAIIAENYQ